MTNKKIIHILNKKIENDTNKNSDSIKKKKINIHRNFSAFEKVVNKIDLNDEKAHVTEKVSLVFNNYNQNIDKAENTFLDILKKQEESFLNKFYEKKFNNKVKYS